MSSDGSDLKRAAADLGEPPRGRLAQAVRRHIWAIGGVTYFAEPVAESRRGVGFAEVRDQEGFHTDGRRRRDDLR